MESCLRCLALSGFFDPGEWPWQISLHIVISGHAILAISTPFLPLHSHKWCSHLPFHVSGGLHLPAAIYTSLWNTSFAILYSRIPHTDTMPPRHNTFIHLTTPPPLSFQVLHIPFYSTVCPGSLLLLQISNKVNSIAVISYVSGTVHSSSIPHCHNCVSAALWYLSNFSLFLYPEVYSFITLPNSLVAFLPCRTLSLT